MHVIKVHGILVVKVSKRSTHVICTKSISIRNILIINSMITKSRFSNLILTKLNSRIIIIKLEAEYWSRKFLISINFIYRWKKKNELESSVQLLTNLEQRCKKNKKGNERDVSYISKISKFRNEKYSSTNDPNRIFQRPSNSLHFPSFLFQTFGLTITHSKDCPSLLFIPSFEINWSTADYASPRSSFVPLCDNENT